MTTKIRDSWNQEEINETRSAGRDRCERAVYSILLLDKPSDAMWQIQTDKVIQAVVDKPDSLLHNRIFQVRVAESQSAPAPPVSENRQLLA